MAITGDREVRSDSVEDARAHLQELQVEVQDVGANISIRTRQPTDSEGRTYVVNYQLRLPASIELDITNVNGSIDLIGQVVSYVLTSTSKVSAADRVRSLPGM